MTLCRYVCSNLALRALALSLGVAFASQLHLSAEPLLIDGKQVHEDTPLKGNVEQKAITKSRVSRPSQPAPKRGAAQIIDTGSFTGTGEIKSLSGNAATSEPLPAATSIELPKVDSIKLDAGTAAHSASPSLLAEPPKDKETGGGQPLIDDDSKRASGGGQPVMVRITYYKLDETHPFYAMKLARSLITAGGDVVVFFDKEGTRAVNRHDNVAWIVRGEKAAKFIRQWIEEFIHAGGRVIVSKDWADAYALNGGSVVAGVEVLDDDELARAILNSSKILDY